MSDERMKALRTATRGLLLVFALRVVLRIMIIGTTTYAVFWLDHSGWWFLGATGACLLFTMNGGVEAEVKDQSK